MKEPRSKLWRHLASDMRAKTADNCSGCGVWPFIAWDTPFQPACEWHDEMYLAKESDSLPADYTREFVDTKFFRICCIIAKTDCELNEKAAIYFLIVRRFGGLVW